jgi:hypothetical protein
VTFHCGFCTKRQLPHAILLMFGMRRPQLNSIPEGDSVSAFYAEVESSALSVDFTTLGRADTSGPPQVIYTPLWRTPQGWAGRSPGSPPQGTPRGTPQGTPLGAVLGPAWWSVLGTILGTSGCLTVFCVVFGKTDPG